MVDFGACFERMLDPCFCVPHMKQRVEKESVCLTCRGGIF